MGMFVFESQEMDRSREHFMSPAAYAPFSTNNQFMLYLGCVDPRDEVVSASPRKSLPVIVQTSGGGAGKGLDSQLSLTSYTGEPVSFADGLQYDHNRRLLSIDTVHTKICFFMGHIAEVAAEMANPSDFTKDSESHWIAHHELRDSGIDKRLGEISNAANLLLPQLVEVDPEDMVREVDAIHPHHQNVIDKKGENRAKFYIVNHHPVVGLNRNTVHRGKDPLTVHAYHDSLGKLIDILHSTRGMPRDIKDLRLASLVRRTAAMRAIVARANPGLEFLNVVATRHGLQVQQESV